MEINELIKEKRNEILKIAASHGAKNVRIFGSVARGEETSDSDIDILVDLESDKSLFDLGAMLLDLQELLNCKVHLLTEKSLHWYIRDSVLKEAVPL